MLRLGIENISIKGLSFSLKSFSLVAKKMITIVFFFTILGLSSGETKVDNSSLDKVNSLKMASEILIELKLRIINHGSINLNHQKVNISNKIIEKIGILLYIFDIHKALLISKESIKSSLQALQKRIGIPTNEYGFFGKKMLAFFNKLLDSEMEYFTKCPDINNIRFYI